MAVCINMSDLFSNQPYQRKTRSKVAGISSAERHLAVGGAKPLAGRCFPLSSDSYLDILDDTAMNIRGRIICYGRQRTDGARG